MPTITEGHQTMSQTGDQSQPLRDTSPDEIRRWVREHFAAGITQESSWVDLGSRALIAFDLALIEIGRRSASLRETDLVVRACQQLWLNRPQPMPSRLAWDESFREIM